MSTTRQPYTPDIESNLSLFLDPALELYEDYEPFEPTNSHVPKTPIASFEREKHDNSRSMHHNARESQVQAAQFAIPYPPLSSSTISGDSFFSSELNDHAISNLTKSYDQGTMPPNIHRGLLCDTPERYGSLESIVQNSFAPKAMAFVETWIKQSPGVLPVDSDIIWLAQGTGQQPQHIRQIFGHFLGRNTSSNTEPPKGSSLESLSNRTRELHLQVDDHILSHAATSKKASEWLIQNRTVCRAQSDSRSSQDFTRPWRCTVGCNQRFARKDIWKEHEEKVYPPRAWVCTMEFIVAEDGVQKCSLCGAKNPGITHWDELHPGQIPCSRKSFSRGTTIFHPRKLFLSHLKNVHPGLTHSNYLKQNCFDVEPAFDTNCPICHDHNCHDWNGRVQHISEHFQPARASYMNSANHSGRVKHESISFEAPATASKTSRPKLGNSIRTSRVSLSRPKITYKDSFSSQNDSAPYVKGLHDYESPQHKSHSATVVLATSVQPNAEISSNSDASVVEQRSTVGTTKPSHTLGIISTVKDFLCRLGSFSFGGENKIVPEILPSTSKGAIAPTTSANAGSLSNISLAIHAPSAGSRPVNNQPSEEPHHSHLLEEQLTEARICTHDMRYFIPADTIQHLITEDSVSEELFGLSLRFISQDDKQLAESITRISRRLFGILTLLGRSRTIREFLAENISDEDLPFRSTKLLVIPYGSQPVTLDLETSSGKLIQAFSTWRQRHISDFTRDQWSFLAPHFRKGIRHFDFDDSVILPYIEDASNGSKEGGFSLVYGVRIHAAHQDFYQYTNNEAPRIALKRLHSANLSRFEKETHMLKQLAPKNHPHLIKLLGTYHHQRAYHLMFPFAKENLRGYWQRVQQPWETPSLIPWTLRQLRGIASGLEAIHDFSLEEEILLSPKITPGLETNTTLSIEEQTQIAVPQRRMNTAHLSVPKKHPNNEVSKWGRHGDIKPENILWFDDDANAPGSAESHGLLVLADFGLMEFHKADTRSRVDPESIGGTPTYEPPERRLRQPISRAFDIWSMGCMMLEFVTWLLESDEGVESFSAARLYPIYDGFELDTFYEIESHKHSSAVVNPRVLAWIERLLKHNRRTKVMQDLLVLIRDRLLVINSKERMSSKKLIETLDLMLERAKEDHDYMFRTPQPATKKSGLRYDSSTEDLRRDVGPKRARFSISSTVDNEFDTHISLD